MDDAKALAKGMPDRTGRVKRDARVIEGQGGIFTDKSKGYIVMQIESIIDQSYQTAFGPVMAKLRETGGSTVTYDNGDVKKVNPTGIKYLGGSTVFDDASIPEPDPEKFMMKIPGPEGEMKVIAPDMGVCCIMEFENHETALKYWDTPEQRSAFCEVLGKNYADMSEEDYTL